MSAQASSQQEEGNVRSTFECVDTLWHVVKATVVDELNAPYRATIHLRAEDENADPLELLGKSCSLHIHRDVTELKNVYQGVVHHIEDGSPGDEWNDIVVEVSAGLALLAQTRQTRVFQDMTVPEILDQVLTDGLKPYKRKVDISKLQRTYPKCEYRVQYDQSDLDFIHRLAEEEGITYRFTRLKDNGDPEKEEKLVFYDDPKAHEPVQSTEGADITFSTYSGPGGGHECISNLTRASRLRPTKLSARHFDWTRPDFAIEQEHKEDDGSHGAALGPEREMYVHDVRPPTLHEYDTGKKAFQNDDSKIMSQIHRERHARDAVVMRGEGKVLGLGAGISFNLQEHVNLDGEYRVTRVTHVFESDGGGIGAYRNDFECLLVSLAWRPSRRTQKPKVVGVETAVVIGPQDKEVHTDEHGRVRVRFPWDRVDANNKRTSCFVRVNQSSAGPGYGFVFLPRVGTEVTVAFIHGDPDRPIIIGSVYNGSNVPPYDLTTDMTRSVIRTQSTQDTGGYNELSFEDENGSEEVYLRAQKNLREDILNNHTMAVGNDQKIKVGNDRKVTVGNLQEIIVEGGERRTITAGAHETVDGNQEHFVTGSFTEEISGDVACKVGMSVTEEIGVNLEQSVGLNAKQTVGGNSNLEVTGQAVFEAMAHYMHAKLGIEVKADLMIDLFAAQMIGMTAGVEISLTAPKISMNTPSWYSFTPYKVSLNGATQSNTVTSMNVTGISTGITGTSLNKTVTTLHTETTRICMRTLTVIT